MPQDGCIWRLPTCGWEWRGFTWCATTSAVWRSAIMRRVVRQAAETAERARREAEQAQREAALREVEARARREAEERARREAEERAALAARLRDLEAELR